MKKMLMLNILKLSLIGVFYTPQCIDSGLNFRKINALRIQDSANGTASNESNNNTSNNARGGCGHRTVEQVFENPVQQTNSLGDFRKNNPQIVHQVQNPVHQVQKTMRQGDWILGNRVQTVPQGNLSFKNPPQIVQQEQKQVHQVQKQVQNEMQKIDPNKRYYKCLNLTDQSHKNIADKFKSLAEEFQLTQEKSHKKESHKEILSKFVNLTKSGKESIYVNRGFVTSDKKLHTTVCSGCTNAKCNKTDDYDQNTTQRTGTFHIWQNDVTRINNNIFEKSGGWP